MKTCRHCRKHPVNRPRRLCFGCYHKPDVRSQYPPKANQHGGVFVASNVDFYGTAQPCVPTRATPGTAEKIAILESRVQARQDLHHPRDVREKDLRREALREAG